MPVLSGRLGRSYERSRLRTVLTSLARRSQWSTAVARNAVVTAVLVAIRRRLAALASGSRLVAFLTKPPDHEVILLDLRATHTLGPLLSLTTAVSSVLAPYYRRVRIRLSAVRARALLGLFGLALGVVTTVSLTIAAFVTTPSGDALVGALVLVELAVVCVVLSTRRTALTDSRVYTAAHTLFRVLIDTRS